MYTCIHIRHIHKTGKYIYQSNDITVKLLPIFKDSTNLYPSVLSHSGQTEFSSIISNLSTLWKECLEYF